MTTPGNGEPSSPARRTWPPSASAGSSTTSAAAFPPPPPSLVVGIGDDAAVAVVDRGALQVLTTDALVEGVHFDRRFSTPADIGYKALAVNVSDIAAMGAAPRLALLSLMLPPALPLADVDGLLDGLLQVAAATGVTLAGGNITRSPGPLVVDVTVVGSVRPRRILTRSGGRPGDSLVRERDDRRRGGRPGLAARARRARVRTARGRGAGRLRRAAPASGAAGAPRRAPRPDSNGERLHGPERRPGRCRPTDRRGERRRRPDCRQRAADPSRRGALVSPRRASTRCRPASREAMTTNCCSPFDPRARPAPSRRAAGPRRAADPHRRAHRASAALVVERGGAAEPLPAGFVHF